MRLLGAGAPGSILLALKDGPRRTMDLATRVPGYTPRTIYRYVTRIVEIGAIEREEEAGVPSKVVHRLTDPSGVELCELVDRYAHVALEMLPDGGIVPHSWGALILLADLWESGMFEELSESPCTATELARAHPDLSFHQVSRRINLYLIGGMIREANEGGRRRRYELTEEARRGTALINGLGGWRERNLVSPGESGLTAGEAAKVLRSVLPLVVLPEHAGKSLELTVLPASADGEEETVVWAEVERDGAVTGIPAPRNEVDGRERREIGEWIEVLHRGSIAKNGVEGDAPLVEAFLRRTYDALWSPRENGSHAS